MIIIRAGLKCGGQPVRTQPFVICVSTGQFPRLSLRQQKGLCYDENNKFSFAKGELGMKKTILLVILQQYADWEAAYIASAITMLGQGQYEVKTVSLVRDCVQSIGGLRVLPDYDIASAPEVYEALILIGGMTWRSEQTQQIKLLVEDCCQKGRILGGICDAAGFLGTVGVLNHVKHTGNDMQDLKQWAGSNYTGRSKLCGQTGCKRWRYYNGQWHSAAGICQRNFTGLTCSRGRKNSRLVPFSQAGLLYSAYACYVTVGLVKCQPWSVMLGR